MSAEIDPWTLSRRTPIAVVTPTPSAVRANRVLGFTVVALGALYVVSCIVEIFMAHGQSGFAAMLDGILADAGIFDDGPTQDEVNQFNAAQSHVVGGAWLATIIFLGLLIAVIAWETRLAADLGNVGMRGAALRRAGHRVFRGSWVASIVPMLFVFAETSDRGILSGEDLISHDHTLMIYFALRAAVGLVVVGAAYRLVKTVNDGYEMLVWHNEPPSPRRVRADES